MADLGESSKNNPSILVSRNAPVSLVVGAGGFLGSFLSEDLLKKGVQVIALDNFSSGNKKNLEEATKDRKFHLLNQSIADFSQPNLPRLDYAFFVADAPDSHLLGLGRSELFKQGLRNFLKIVENYQAKIVLVSSIELYNTKLSSGLNLLKNAEIEFAKFTKEHKLNARVVRLAPVFGPRMHFRSKDPVSRLVQASLLGELQDEQTSLEFSSRAIFVSDAVDLIMKTVFSGSTAQKIYDGALTTPVKVSEIKQILLDPMWYEERGFTPTEIPPWPTPNLKKSLKELSWKPKTPLIKALKKTVVYFKEDPSRVPDFSVAEFETEAKRWQLEAKPEEVLPEERQQKTKDKKPVGVAKTPGQGNLFWGRTKRLVPILLGLGIIVYALFYPLATVIFGSLSTKAHLQTASDEIEKGDFQSAAREVTEAKYSLDQLIALADSLVLLKKIPGVGDQLSSFEDSLKVLDQGVEGAGHAVTGAQSLFALTNIISGESSSDPKPLIDKAQLEFGTANQDLSQVSAKLSDASFTDEISPLFSSRVSEFKDKLVFYSDLVEKGRITAQLLPQVIGLNDSGAKTYLLLFPDNYELRGAGGYIGAYGLITFEGGKVRQVKIDATKNLDSSFTQHIEPPAELKSDVGITDWKLSDSGFDPDFPVSAKRAEFFYDKEAGKLVNGVISLDVTAVSALLSSVSGADLPDYSEHVDGADFPSKVLTHVNDVVSGSDSTKNYLASTNTPLWNKIFFLSNKNWAAIIGAMAGSLSQKHMMIYLDDQSVLSYTLAEDWSGALARAGDSVAGETQDFMAPIDSNMGQNLDNFYLKRSYSLQTTIDAEGGISHHLETTFKNSAPSADLPGGVYKDRFRIYLPLGTKLTAASFDGKDILSQVSSFSDYGRAGYSLLLQVNPGEEKKLVLEYALSDALSFQDSSSQYQLNLFKQAGTDKDSFEWNLSFPDNLKPTQINGDPVTSGNRVINVKTDLSANRSLSVGFDK